MSSSIQSNLSSLGAKNQIDRASAQLQKAQLRLSTGSKVSDPSASPSDAAVGYTMGTTISALNQASSTVTQATAMIQLATGALGGTNELLTRMYTLASQASSDTISDGEREMLQQEFIDLKEQVDQNSIISWGRTKLLSGGVGTATLTSFAGATLTPGAGMSGTAAEYELAYDVINTTVGRFTLTNTSTNAVMYGYTSSSTDVSGANISQDDTVFFADGTKIDLSSSTFDGHAAIAAEALATFTEGGRALSIDLQIGARPTDTLSLNFDAVTTQYLDLDSISITSLSNAQTAGEKILAAMDIINKQIAYLGGKKSQLESIGQGIATSIQNQVSAKETFTDADIPEELMATQKDQSLIQTSRAVFSQGLTQVQDLADLVRDALR